MQEKGELSFFFLQKRQSSTIPEGAEFKNGV